ncbi:MAG: c-type cytochrome [Pseudomonadota bacterium]
MKKIWMLSVLFVFAGCQPDVQESPVAPPVSVSKSDAEPEATPVAVTPNPQKESAKIETAPQVRPVQPKAVPEKTASGSEVAIAPTVEVVAPISEVAETKATTVAEPKPVAEPTAQLQLSETQAMALAKKKNCFACHALDKKMVGPAWRAVAERYRGDAGAQAALESKVRKGGKGNWGGMAMPPQPALSGEELTGLVQFVLQLK